MREHTSNVNVPNLIQQVKALPHAEQQQFMDAMMDFDLETHSASDAVMQAPDFQSFWQHLHSLGMPVWTAEETADFDRWLANDNNADMCFSLSQK